ncbi:helix-turn-helix domain-containing protein [Endozoicomonas gorgoniicola]|uniref:Helix-turn-helix domain-containing protein n=1 Tax=Endozoicomonas gorgoniicola TaxID=1234144 RepID=A0ABT3N148_9GAMM|nr:NadS family protein [Endozoicomonas gorgoniicola]MCW7555363.1 helix-turn-helix domain-containing protein [Endozoicomonas gorgoniicola]
MAHTPDSNHSVFDDIMQGLDEAVEFTKGKQSGAIVHDVSPLDVKDIRQQLDMTQEEFARAVGVKLPTLRHWERGDRKPNGPARVLLNLLAREPKQIVAMLGLAHP